MAIGRRSWGPADVDADPEEVVGAKGGGGSSEGKSKGESAVGPSVGMAEYTGRMCSSPSSASWAALLASSSFVDIVTTWAFKIRIFPTPEEVI
jgi:hypothetical protein